MGYEDKKVKEKTPQRALEVLKWMCSKSEKTKQDCVKSLYRWSVPASEHQKILDELVEEKFVDEKRYARLYVSEKHNFYKWGKTKIVFFLKSKGIESSIINEVCSEIIEENSGRENLKELIEKKAKKFEPIPYQEKYKIKVKLFQWAYSRGYSTDEINYCLENYFNKNRE